MPDGFTRTAQAQERVIRVFVSSTFRDMEAERDHLVKFIFPQLRKLCESRGVTWGEVDLRWGITEEQSERGEIVSYCLEEIDRCRPYFIGLLGDYYGTLARRVAPDLKPQEGWPEDSLERSVTELEIIHGVLANPQMADHAFFYFRDPAYARSLPEEQRQAFTNPDPAAESKLAALKERIRQEHHDGNLKRPARENYRNPEVLGRAIRRDFTRLINTLFPVHQQPDPLAREAADHEAFAESRARVYIGRQEYFDRLDAHVDSNELPLVVLGESGIGKSALLANWFLRYREQHPDDFALIHFIGGTPDSADPIRLLRRIMLELKRRSPNRLPDDVPAQPEKIREEFPQWLARGAAGGRIVLILDGLNQLEDRDAAPELGWLPVVFPPNCGIILSALPGRSLDATRRHQWPELTVQPLTGLERKELLEKFLAQFSRRLSPARVERIAAAEQTANPLFLRAMLDELRQFGEHEQLGERIDHYLAARDPEELYERILERWEQDYSAGQDLVRQSLSLIWAARRGLSEAEILDLLGKDNQPLPRAMWTPFYLAAEASLAEGSSLLAFSHNYVREAVRNRILSSLNNQERQHRCLAEYFDGQQELTNRKIDELPWQWQQAEEWERLKNLLTNLTFLLAAWMRSEFEVKSYWASLKSSAGVNPADAYRPLLDDSNTRDGELEVIAHLLWGLGHPKEAAILRGRLVDRMRHRGDRVSLANVLPNYAVSLRASGNLDEAVTIYEEAIELSQALGDVKLLSICFGNLAVILTIKGDLHEALRLLTEQERLCRSLRDDAGLARSLGNRGAIFKRQGLLDEAIALYEEEENLCRQTGNPIGLAIAKSSRAEILKIRGSFEPALQILREAEEIDRQFGNTRGLAGVLGDQALILEAGGELQGALAVLRQAEELWRDLGEPGGLARNLGNQSKILSAHARFAEALTSLDQAEQIFRALSDRDGLAGCLSNRALIFTARGNLDGAQHAYEQAERIYRELEAPSGLAACLGNLGYVLRLKGELHKAMAMFKEQQTICQRLGDRAGVARALGNRAILVRAQGKPLEAVLLHKQEEEAFRQLNDPAGLQVSLGNQATIHLAAGHNDQAMALLSEEEQICRQLNNPAGLARCLGNQALVFRACGDTERSMELHTAAEALFKEIGDPLGLSVSMGGRAMLLATTPGRRSEAISLAREAFQIASDHGLKDAASRLAEVMRLITSNRS